MENTQGSSTFTKVPTGITGLDDITFGGLPFARSSLVSGYAGSGKTVLAFQFILNGIEKYNEPGVFISLEETEEDLRKNMSTFEYDVREMEKNNMLHIETIRIKSSSLFHSGHFDLSPILLRIEEAIKKVKAKRIAIDTFELIFNEIHNINIFRQELTRLILWLKEKQITAIFTSEQPSVNSSRNVINEFITDCVINLTHAVVENIYTRKLHILKYRGSRHGTNDYPFLINKKGIVILPITTVDIHHISSETFSTGIQGLDKKIDNGGLYVASCTLISGTAGTGKTSIATSICVEMIKKEKRCLFFTFEESAPQLKRNMKSLGFDLQGYEDRGLLKIVSTRPTTIGIEAHLVSVYKNIEDFEPGLVVFDPISDLVQIGTKKEVRGMLIRINDYLKNKLTTIIFTALSGSSSPENDLQLSSLVDNWIKLGANLSDNELGINIVKIRGMGHARKRFLLHFSEKGLKIQEKENPE